MKIRIGPWRWEVSDRERDWFSLGALVALAWAMAWTPLWKISLVLLVPIVLDLEMLRKR